MNWNSMPICWRMRQAHHLARFFASVSGFVDSCAACKVESAELSSRFHPEDVIIGWRRAISRFPVRLDDRRFGVKDWPLSSVFQTSPEQRGHKMYLFCCDFSMSTIRQIILVGCVSVEVLSEGGETRAFWKCFCPVDSRSAFFGW